MRQRKSINFSRRWQWLTRPHWIVCVIVVVGFLGWLFWPIKLYRSDVRNFLMVSQGPETQILGVVRINWEVDPSKADDRLEAVMAKAESTREVEGAKLWWLFEAGRPTSLRYALQNAVIEIDPSDGFEGTSRGEARWYSRLETAAVSQKAEMESGALGGRAMTIHHAPRAMLLFREEIASGKKKLTAWWRDLRP